MSLTRRLLTWLRFPLGRSRTEHRVPNDLNYDVLLRAHGDWIALLATILDREGVVASAELARLLAEFAAITAVDKPAEGRILSAWASSLKGTAERLRDHPSLH